MEAALLALEAQPDARSVTPARRTRPLLDAAQLILRNAPRAVRETAVLYQQTGTPRGLALSADNNLLLSHSLNAKKVALFD